MNKKVVTGIRCTINDPHDLVPDREENLATSGKDILNEAILEYVAAARPAQELLRQLLTQIAGYALVLMTREKPASRAEASILMARTSADRACDQLRALKVPAAAAHHYHHLSNAGEAIRWAMIAAEKCASGAAADSERNALTHALKTASEHLRATARWLPGFDLVDFSQACCAAHGQRGLVGHENKVSGLKEDKNGGLFNMGSGIRCS
jgi:hypothetical protein